jgi:hypothetical protein
MSSKPINRIDITKQLNEPEGFDIHDYLREGRQYELSPRKLSAFIKIMFRKINELVDEVNKLKREKV